MSAILLALLLTQLVPPENQARIVRAGRTERAGGRAVGFSYGFFEAFPLTGAGALACSGSLTGAKGEVLTFTRAGTATCLKSSASTGILPGDLVALTNNQPRIVSVAGLLAFLRESARTNNCPRSEEIDNAAWTDEIFGAGTTPVVTANFALSPRNDLTADRVQFGATSGSDESMRYMGGACGSPCVGTCFVMGTSGSGTMDMCAGTAGCSPCNFVAGSYTRCQAVGNAGAFLLGNGSRYNGGVARAASDVLVWGCQTETASFPTSYIPTTSAAASRVVDSTLGTTLSSAVGPVFSLRAAVATLGTSAAASVAAQLGTVAPDLASVGRASDTSASFTINATSTTPATPSQGLTMHTACMTDNSTESAWWDGSLVAAPSAAMTAGSTELSFGALDAYTALVLVDPSPTRCP